MLENNPKWEALTEVLQEIEKENKSSDHKPGQPLEYPKLLTVLWVEIRLCQMIANVQKCVPKTLAKKLRKTGSLAKIPTPRHALVKNKLCI